MLTHPALFAAVAMQRHQDLIDAASRYRLAREAQRSKRRRRRTRTTEMSDPLGTLDLCEAVGQARS